LIDSQSFIARFATEHITSEDAELVSRGYPMPRLCEPADVANAVPFRTSDEGAFVNGTTLMVDGGASIYMPSARVDASN
jgi:NAD(P)-dependent dehydrogenase (short-subunit alcohol dehydrogenase family)